MICFRTKKSIVLTVGHSSANMRESPYDQRVIGSWPHKGLLPFMERESKSRLHGFFLTETKSRGMQKRYTCRA